MARELKDILTDTFNAMLQQPTLVSAFSLDPTKTYDQQNKSATALWYLIMWIGCYIAWVIETLFDNHEAIVLGEVADLKPHSANWYKEKVLAFMNGYDVVEASGEYDLTGLSDSQITTAKVIKHCAIQELNNKLIIKAAQDDGSGGLTKLDADVKTNLETYLNKIKDGGVFIDVIRRDPDILKINIDLYYDPMILNSLGARIDGTATTPVLDAVKTYLQNLNSSFNARFLPTELVDAMQAVSGVKIPVLTLCQWKDGTGLYNDVGAFKQPFSGFFTTIGDDGDQLNINYIAYN